MRFARLWSRAGAALYLALAVVPLLRVVDGATGTDGWSPLDGGSFFDEARAGVLWPVWLSLWGAALLFWWVGAPVLAGAAGGSRLRALSRVILPGFAAGGAVAVVDDALTAHAPVLGERVDAERARQRRLGRAVVTGGFLTVPLFCLLPIVAIAAVGRAFTDGDAGFVPRFVYLGAMFLPLSVAPAVRVIQLRALARVLEDVDVRNDPVRASAAEPVGG